MKGALTRHGRGVCVYSDGTIYEGLKKVFWPGRLQKVAEKIFYDVSHNENGLKNTLQTLKRLFL